MKISREIKVGIVAIISIAMFYWGYNFLKGVNILKSTASYYAVYDDIGGLIESGVVYLNGYKVGQVAAINFDERNPGKIIVKYSIREGLKLPKYTTAQIVSSSIISGIKDIKLILGDSDEYHAPGDTLLPDLDNGITDMVEPLKATASEILSTIDTLTKGIDDILNPERREEIKDAISHLEDVSSSINDQLADDGSLSMSFKNIADITETIKNQNEQLTNIIRNLSSLSDTLMGSEIKMVIAEVNEAINNTNVILAKIQSGEGTMGMLVNNDSLYNNLNNVSQNLDSLLVDLRKNPKRYMHFSVFGKK